MEYVPSGARSPLAFTPSQENAVSPVASASIVSTTTPLASVISKVTLPAPGDITRPVALPEAGRARDSEGTTTECPTSEAPFSTWSPVSEAVNPLTVVLRSLMPCTVENCASWATNSLLDSGFSGSWLASCSVISRMKSACPSVSAFLAVVAAPVVPVLRAAKGSPLTVVMCVFARWQAVSGPWSGWPGPVPWRCSALPRRPGSRAKRRSG